MKLTTPFTALRNATLDMWRILESRMDGAHYQQSLQFIVIKDLIFFRYSYG